MLNSLRSHGLTPIWLVLAVVVPSVRSAPVEDDADDARDRQVMERFLGVLEKNPRRGTALDRVYGYHVERGTLDAFVKSYHDRAEKDPRDGSAWLLLGLLESQRGHDAAAVAALKKAEETRPDDPLPSYYLGRALVLVGQPDAAAEALERAIARKPARADLLEIYQALGRIHQRAQRHDRALEVWTRLENAFPDDSRVQEQIAAALAEEADPARALPRYEALAKKTTDPYRKVQYRVDAAELKVRLNKRQEALADFESLLGGLNPDSWLHREVRRKIEDVFLRNDDQAGLAAYYEGWLKKSPEDVEAMSRLGRALASQGRIADAQIWFDKAVKLAPSRKELRLALVEQLTQEKKFAEAAAQYEAMAKSDPANPDLVRDWGRLLLKDATKPEPERKRAAAEVWKKLLDARPNDGATAVLVADLFRQAEMPDQAIEQYRKAIALSPESAQYYEYLGEYYHSLKRKDEALATWAKLADGKNRTAKNLGRLAEVLSGFGYNKEALAPSAAACGLDKKSFDLQIKYADLLFQAERYGEALGQIDAAARAADDAEQTEAAFDLQIKTYVASNQLDKRIGALRGELEAGKDATADRWRRLARLDEAAQKVPEAIEAVGKAVALDPKSIPAWSAYARIHEASGDFGGAVDAYRKLAKIDRRALTEHLTQAAKLEVRLGRRDRALQAGREVLAAAPGNPESYQFFAELCTQLGEVEEGLNTLRRAVRVNPADTKALLSLAEALAREFRTEEAIELYWRAFDKAAELDARLGIVARLTDLHLQRNQFDRLVARLEREQREEKRHREMVICLAQAYQASGDYGSARAELERLLATNPRDTTLLQQLSNLAENDGDLVNAVKYQRQLNEIAPTDEGTSRLAQLHLRAGETSEAEAIWARMAGGKQETGRVLQTVDQLLSNGKEQTVLGITERLLRDQPGQWEALYREGVALAHLEKPAEAERRFRAILDLREGDDELSEAAKSALKKQKAGRPAARNSRVQPLIQPPTSPLQSRAQNVWQIRQAAGLQGRDNYGYGQQTRVWTPGDFGQARMAAIAWLLNFAQKQDKLDDRVKELRAADDTSPRKLWDSYYLSLDRQEPVEIHASALALARAAGAAPEVLLAYLTSLPQRAGLPEQANNQAGADALDQTPPLAADELERVLASYRALRRRRPEWVDSPVLNAVATELKRAKRNDESDRFYREAVEAANDPASVMAAIGLAVERGDADTFLKLLDRHLKLGAGTPNAGGLGDFVGQFQLLMAQRSEAKDHAGVLKLFDAYWDWFVRPEQAASRLRVQQSGVPNNPSAANFQLRFGKQYKYVNVDYPAANRWFDAPAIQMLRAAFEIDKRDDLLSDLFARIGRRAEKDPEAARIYPMLALGYLHWWNDDKDEALAALTRAVAQAKADPDLKLELAELRARRNENDEALALVDSVEATDQKTMQRREVLALRYAVLTGNVARARQASERLFNLRLDTDLQVQLAAQMHQLGMHDLAEAVLARARRRAGSNTNTLVGLMQQYQRQDKMDVAVQVAHQILRRAPARKFSPYQDEGDVAQREAIQVLARSGKLQEMIGRVETQLKTSPNSIQLLQTLADYHKAAGEPVKARAAQDKILKLRPDDAGLRYQIAMDLVRSGETAAAVDYFKAAITKEPSLFSYRYWEIQNAFQQAGKMEDLAQIFEDLDVKKLGNVWTVERVISELLQNEKTRERGLRLFRKVWKAFPLERGQLITSFYNDDVWRLPEMYDYAREAVIPNPAAKLASRWTGIDQVNSWSGGGRVNGVAERLLNAAARQNKLEALGKEIEEGVKRVPEWTGGKAYLALVDIRRGKTDEAKKIVEDLLADDKNGKDPIPHAALLFLGQEMENFGPLLPLAITLYETADKKDERENGLDFEYHPIRRLIAIYRKAGRVGDARDLIMKFARRPDGNQYDAGYAAYRKLESLSSIGRELTDLGFPADAVPLYNEALSDPEMLRKVARFYGGGEENYMVQQLRNGLNQGLRGLNEKNLPQTLKTIMKSSGGAGAPALDLVLLIHPREADRAEVTSLFAEAVKAGVSRPELRVEIDSRLKDLSAQHPKDFSIQTALALAADKPAALAEAAERLAKLADDAPLEDLSAGARANSRQRAEAAKRLGLWLVARECWKHDETRKLGDPLASHALDAARRQTDPLWSLAMLREWGQTAFDRGDRAGAERLWTRMLDQILAGPGDDKARAGSAPVTTLDRFDLAAQLAKLAANRGLMPLSLRAARQALAGGPPVVPIPIDENNQPGMRIQRNNADAEVDPAAKRVEARLAELGVFWKRKQAPAAEVYEVLRETVLPATRPSEIFLYPRPLAEDVRSPRSVAAELSQWAARAGKVDDLRRLVAARQGRPLAELNALALRVSVEIAARDWPAAVQALEALDAKLKKDTLQNSATLACVAALPALVIPETSKPATAVIERAVKNLAGAPNDEPLSGLHLALAHAFFQAGRIDDGRKQILGYQSVLNRNMPNYGGDYGLYVRKERLQKVAAEFARAGQWADALDVLGQFVDAPVYRGGDPSLGVVMPLLARQFTTLPARDAYDKLKAWTLPSANRKSVRLLASYVPEDAPPEVFGKFSTSAFQSGVASTSGMLIAASREAGTLDELAAEASKLAALKVENGEALFVLVQIARELGPAVKARVATRLAALKAPNQNRPVLWADRLIAVACLNDPVLRRDPGEALAQELIDRSQSKQDWAALGHLRRDLAASVAARAGSEAVKPGADPGLAHWHPTTTVTANRHAAGSPSAWWVASEGHVRQICGPEEQMLMLDCPLTGRFEFSVDAWLGGWAEGHAGYGGLVAEANSNGVPSGLYPVGRGEYLRLPSPFAVHDAFNRMTVQVEPGKVRYLVNGHLFYQDDDPSPTSPWVFLSSTWSRQTTFRNPTVTGMPEIPREVALTQGDRLEGWASNFLNQSQPPRRTVNRNDSKSRSLAAEMMIEQYDWVSRDGVIQCRRTEASSGSSAVQSRLYHHRPLRDGDALAYEFHYEPGEVEVHPALDRLAFVLDPKGVRLHWITDGPDDEWTGLKTDNLADEPAHRRGPEALPLKSKAWNAVIVAISGNTAVLTLNGTEIYRRPLEPANSRQFGFFQFRDQAAVQARNVVLKGNWPKSLPPDLMAMNNENDPAPDRRARHDLIGEEMMTKAAGPVLKVARKLSPEQKYTHLSRWVLPLDDRGDLRVSGVSSPVDGAPPVASAEAVPADNPSNNRIHTGGQFEAPARDLVNVARQLDKLGELSRRVEQYKPEDERNQRGRLALLALIRIAEKREKEAKAVVNELVPLVKALTPETAPWARQAELLALWEMIGRPGLRAESDTLGNLLIGEWHGMRGRGLHPPRDRDLWGRLVAYATHRTEYLGLPAADLDASAVEVAMPLWSRVTQATAASRALGSPIPRWAFREGFLRHNEGHHADYMYLNVPLRGDFEATCEATGFGADQMHMSYGGVMASVAWNRDQCQVTATGRPLRQTSIQPPLVAKKWYSCRLVVKDRTLTVYFDGRKVAEEALPAGGDPWLALHCEADGHSDLRNLKISGKPTVPAELALSAFPDLTGWRGDYYNEKLDGDAPAWTKQGEEIVGRNVGSNATPTLDRYGREDDAQIRDSVRIGARPESVLQYHRPLIEDGEIAYEFFHLPGKTTVHPALDRLAFVLDPDGVKIHWLTDAQHDHSGLAPDNLTLEPRNRRGPAKLPLKSGEWNRLSLAVKGDAVAFTLNDVLIYEREVEPTNQRVFGLFHYSDETEVRVRNVRYRGDWPKELPLDQVFPAAVAPVK